MVDSALVTGGAGFIGLHLVRALLRRGMDVTIIDDMSRHGDDSEFEAVAADVNIMRHDLTEPFPRADYISDVDYVFHLAGVVGVSNVVSDPVRCLRTNVLGTANVMDWCLENPPKGLFFSSTSEVIDGAIRYSLTDPPADEDQPIVIGDLFSARSSYMLSKAIGEAMLHNASERANFNLRIGRYHNVYGPRMGYDHVIPEFIQRLLMGRDPFEMYGGKCTRAFCYVDDAVSATIELTKLEDPRHIVANIGNDNEEVRMQDLATSLFDLAGASPEIVDHGPPRGSPERRVPDISKLKRLIDFSPQIHLEAGLNRTWQWYVQRYEDAAEFP